MTRHYVTACKAYQLPVLFQSMVRHCQPFVLHVLAWDFDPPASFADPNVRVYCRSRAQFLDRHPELATLPGPPRNTNETVCSVRWRFALDVMEATGQPVSLVDGDCWFVGSPEPMFAEIGDAKVALSPHGFAPAHEGLPGITLESHGRFGKHNGGVSYWADPVPLRRMAELAEEWCYIGFREIGGRQFFGDQGVLALIQEEFGAHDIQHPGVNIAPWNFRRRSVEDKGGTLFVDGMPAILVHFQSLKLGQDGHVIQIADPSYAVPPEYERLLVAPYLAAMGAKP